MLRRNALRQHAGCAAGREESHMLESHGGQLCIAHDELRNVHQHFGRFRIKCPRLVVQQAPAPSTRRRLGPVPCFVTATTARVCCAAGMHQQDSRALYQDGVAIRGDFDCSAESIRKHGDTIHPSLEITEQERDCREPTRSPGAEHWSRRGGPQHRSGPAAAPLPQSSCP